MALDWLFGPKIKYEESNPSIITIRPLLLDLQTVTDVEDHAVTQGFIAGKWKVVDSYGGTKVIPRKALAALSQPEKGRLSFEVAHHVNGMDMRVEFRESVAPQIFINGSTPATQSFMDAMLRQTAKILLESGRPRFDWRRVRHGLPWIGFVLFIAVGTAVAVENRASWAEIVFGLLLTAAVFPVADRLSGASRKKALSARLGHRIRAIDREELAVTRANSKRDWKVGALTFAATAAAGYVLWLATGTPQP